jgi:lactoylglutathione lyase
MTFRYQASRHPHLSPWAGTGGGGTPTMRCHNGSMTELSSLVLFTGHMEQTRAFYRAVGLTLDDEDHGDGPRHYATDLGGVHFALFDAGPPSGRAPQWREPGSSFPGFYVASLDDAVAALAAQGAPVLTAHQPRDWGCRAVIEDPDGRPVEINQRDHCTRRLIAARGCACREADDIRIVSRTVTAELGYGANTHR